MAIVCKVLNALRCIFTASCEALITTLLDWLLLIPVSVYLMVYFCRHGVEQATRLWPRAAGWQLIWDQGDDIKLAITSMSGRSVQVDANSTWNIHDVKQSLAVTMACGCAEDVAANQMRLFTGCVELSDDSLLDPSGPTELSLILRSRECAEWLDKLLQGTSCNLKDASEDVRSSKECVVAAVRSSALALKQVPGFNDDGDVVMAAVQNDGLSLFIASFRLRADPDVALAAVGRDRESLQAVCEPLRRSAEFLRRAYWVSSLDCKPDERFDQHDCGLWEKWEDILYLEHGCLQQKLFSALHKHLRQSRSFLSMWRCFCSLAPLLFPNFPPKDEFFWGHPWLGVFLIYMMVFIVAERMIQRPMSTMHVDFVNYMAGPLLNARRSSNSCV